MQAIVAVDRNWGIGYNGSLLVSIPNDHKMFRQEPRERPSSTEERHLKPSRWHSLWIRDAMSFCQEIPPIRCAVQRLYTA